MNRSGISATKSLWIGLFRPPHATSNSAPLTPRYGRGLNQSTNRAAQQDLPALMSRKSLQETGSPPPDSAPQTASRDGAMK